ncbi:hypothetical protein J4210_02425 [Candidatus Woesearchaeota archaeon]|nr:hypothetical protein [Candidatus Woesearchaeota archaeon]
MYKIPLAELKEKITKNGALSSIELDEKIKEKINELSGLISEEGAAHIIANELGIELISTATSQKLKVKEIYSGMRNISVVGQVVQKYEPRTFTKGDSLGRVCSVLIGDETGTIRLVFWNEQVDQAVSLRVDDVVRVNDVYVRENNAAPEIHLGSRGTLDVNPEGETVSSVRKSSKGYERRKIEELKETGDTAEIVGTIVQVFDPRFFYTCPQCNKKALENSGTFLCGEHGAVEANLAYVLNAVLDDGTGMIRGVFWKNQTNYLLGKDEVQVGAYKEELPLFEDVKNDLLGEQFKLLGKVNRNEMFDRLEFNVQIVEKAKPEEEMLRLEQQES